MAKRRRTRTRTVYRAARRRARRGINMALVKKIIAGAALGGMFGSSMVGLLVSYWFGGIPAVAGNYLRPQILSFTQGGLNFLPGGGGNGGGPVLH